jgi:hypothetical protein
MNNHQLRPIVIEGQPIYWRVVSGIALGVQKYQKFYLTNSSGFRTNANTLAKFVTVIELSIMQNDGNELFLTLNAGDIRVRDGQNISVMFGCCKNEKQCLLIFVNHYYQRWHWLNTPSSFFSTLEIIMFSPVLSRMKLLIMGLFSLLGGLLLSRYPDPGWIYRATPVAFIFFFITMSLFFLVQSILQARRVRSAWKILQPQVSEMVTRLR